MTRELKIHDMAAASLSFWRRRKQIKARSHNGCHCREKVLLVHTVVVFFFLCSSLLGLSAIPSLVFLLFVRDAL